MANIKSQIKRNRQNEARRIRNRSERSALRTKNRRFNEALASDDSQAA
ncbi:MAG: 30S ribosomal protein S20, partial [Actinobacteria bacterium]|nr:30S ribosomal protein S20 [Actinomycetota bacterium]